MRIRSFSILAGLCALAWADAASAQHVPSPYRFFETSHEVSLIGGWVRPGTGHFGYGPGPGPVVGLRYGIELSGPLSLEAGLGYMPLIRDVVDPGRLEGDRIIGEADADLLEIDARVKMSLTGRRTWRGLNPFIVAGAGLVTDLSGEQPLDERLLLDDRFDMGTSVVGLAGGGLRWFLSDHVVVRGEALLNLWRISTPSGWQDPARDFELIGESEWVSGPLLTFGIGYRF